MSAVAAHSDVFRAIADPTRRQILDLLRHKERSASELAEPFRMSQPAVSQHLRVLRDAGLVRARRDGRQQVYCIDPRPLRVVFDWIGHYERFWPEKLDQLDRYLEKKR